MLPHTFRSLTVAAFVATAACERGLEPLAPPDASSSLDAARGDASPSDGFAGDARGDSAVADVPPPPPGAPVLFFTDLESGPKTGWQGGTTHGAAVTVWGRNFGATRGTSTATIGGVTTSTDADFLAWGGAGPMPGLERITLLVPASAADGPGAITVTVGGVTSNPLPFTVRAGALRYVATSGNDSNDGSYARPWRTIRNAADSIAAGDIAYLGDGIRETTGGSYNAVVNLGRSGAPGRPKALVGLPGATVRVGSTSVNRAFHNWETSVGGYAEHWLIANLRITGGEICVNANTGFRIVGNVIDAPEGDGQSGCLDVQSGNDVKILGNELSHVGAESGSKLYHGIYISGPRTGSGTRLPTMRNREVGWNYFHDNRCNRAINVYSEQDRSSFIEGHRIHDNVIVDQRGDGILLGYYVTGENWIYNNVIVRAGLGPDWVDDASTHAGIRIAAGHEEAPATVHVAHNTVFGCGYAAASFGSTAFLYEPNGATTTALRNNLFVSTGEPLFEAAGAARPTTAGGNLWAGDTPPAWDGSAVRTAPTFLNAGTGDFHLATGSSGIDVGVDASDVVALDLDGVRRPQGAAPDIGAYER